MLNHPKYKNALSVKIRQLYSIPDKKIIEKQSISLKHMINMNNDKRLVYLSKLKVIHRFSNGNIYSSGVYLLENFIVAKKLYNNMNGYIFWKNEINALKRVLGFRYFPQIVAVDKSNLIIYMTYCGPNMTNHLDQPIDKNKQINEIKNILVKKQLNPNDILPRNVCILNNTIKIIDFGLSNIRYSDIIKSINKLKQLFN